MTYKVLSIAGFDGSGGAGIQADLKTFAAFGCYGLTVLTALPIQNTCGVKSCYEIAPQIIKEQLETIFEDITPDSIKIGMLFKSEIIEVIADFLYKHAQHIPIVLDPVMVAKSGDRLLLPEAVLSLKTKLVPLAKIITPNLPEACSLAEFEATTHSSMPKLAHALLTSGSEAVLLKGGHLHGNTANDFYLDNKGNGEWLELTRIATRNTHGTGCTLSAAIAACLAMGMQTFEACNVAKHYLHAALNAAKNEQIGKGCGPVHHFYHVWPTVEKILCHQ